MGRITTRRRVVRRRLGEQAVRSEDTLVVEEPLDIRIGGRQLAVTMRTPGHDIDLAIGFLLAEGVITSGDDVATGQYCAGATEDGVNTYNVLDITLAPGMSVPESAFARNFVTSSSCGVCGKASIDAVRTAFPHDCAQDEARISAELLATLPELLRGRQSIFDKTGGLHAAGLFDAATGDPLVVREDVGRHNAVDKAIGWAAQHGRIPLRGSVLMVSSRVSFELVQKAAMAGIPMLAAVSAPSSLAVELAQEAGITVAGFVRAGSMVVYTESHRVVDPH